MNRVTITAEISSNWRGDYSLLEDMMVQCERAGVDFVKLQCFKKIDMSKRYDRLSSAVTKDNIEKINDIAFKAQIPWYVMAIHAEDISWLNAYCLVWKLRYKDCMISPKPELFKNMLATCKTILMSTDTPLFNTLSDQVQTLYCISKYPAPLEEIDMEKMKLFNGYSCHTPEKNHIIQAVKNGIRFLEIHVKPDGNTDDLVDDAVSFSLSELPELIRDIRNVQ